MRKDCQCQRVKHRHGTCAAYRCDGCRCFQCRLAYSRAGGRRRADDVLVPAIGVQRRLQSLAWVGWGTYALADVFGVSSTRVEQWRSGFYATIRPETADRVAEVYDRLWNATPANGRGAATRAHNAAVRAGWRPPLAWDDDTIDDPTTEDYARNLRTSRVLLDEVAIAEAMTGRRVTLTQAERSEAIARLTAMGHSADEIGERLGLSGRTVVRFRSRESVAA